MSDYANNNTRIAAAVFGILAGGAIVTLILSAVFRTGYAAPPYRDDHVNSTVPSRAHLVRRRFILMPETAGVAKNANQAAPDMFKLLHTPIVHEMVTAESNTFGREFARRHSLHLVGALTTWFLLRIALYIQFHKDNFTSMINRIPTGKANTMGARQIPRGTKLNPVVTHGTGMDSSTPTSHHRRRRAAAYSTIKFILLLALSLASSSSPAAASRLLVQTSTSTAGTSTAFCGSAFCSAEDDLKLQEAFLNEVKAHGYQDAGCTSELKAYICAVCSAPAPAPASEPFSSLPLGCAAPSSVSIHDLTLPSSETTTRGRWTWWLITIMVVVVVVVCVILVCMVLHLCDADRAIRGRSPVS